MFYVVKLKDVLQLDSFPRLYEKLSDFSSKNSDVADFIKNKAIDFEKRDLSRTYLILDYETEEIAGYFSLSLKVLNFNAEVSNTVKKRIHGITSYAPFASVILIGQLSKNFNYSGTIGGTDILNYAMDVVNKVHELVGCRVCMVETLSSEENKKVVDFYESYGFKKLIDSKEEEYYQLYFRIQG